jgi:hypothetical protein
MLLPRDNFNFKSIIEAAPSTGENITILPDVYKIWGLFLSDLIHWKQGCCI